MNKIKGFQSFFSALTLDKQSFDKQSKAHSVLFKIGQFADQYISLNNQELQIKEGRINTFKVNGHAWKTTIKVISYVVTFFSLFLLALTAKALYRNYCSNFLSPYIHKDLLVPHIEKTKDQIQEKANQPANLDKPKKNYQFSKPVDLSKAANAFIRKPKISNKTRPPILLPHLDNKITLSDHEIIDHWLNHYQGFCIGEYHTHDEPKEFLVDNMPYLKNKGVKVIFMEQIYDDCQADLDTFLQGGPLSKELLYNVESCDRKDFFNYPPYGYQGVLEAAKREGIRIVAIDTKAASYKDQTEEERWITMNYFAYKTMKQTIKEIGNGKYVALMGVGHVSKRKGNIPGVTDLLSCPRIFIKKIRYSNVMKLDANPFSDVHVDMLYPRKRSS